jgi:hypothetical protein
MTESDAFFSVLGLQKEIDRIRCIFLCFSLQKKKMTESDAFFCVLGLQKENEKSDAFFYVLVCKKEMTESDTFLLFSVS